MPADCVCAASCSGCWRARQHRRRWKLPEPAVRAARVEARDRLVAATWDLILEAPQRDPSVREIAAAASVNPAMVSYYFGSKEGLLATLFRGLAEPLQCQRLALLETARASGNVRLEAVLAAWLDPILRQGEAHVRFAALTSLMRLNYAPLYNRVFAEAIDPGNSVFVEALGTCLPHLGRATVIWRLYAVAGMWIQALDDFAVQSMRAMSDGVLDGDLGHLRRQLTLCAEACFRAPDS